MKIAVLITSHNRKDITLSCLFALYKNKEFFDVFLVDDGSTDGTSEAIKSKYSDVNIIQGNGNLFWNQGMRLAWKHAANKKNYDYYIWLNDDTFINDNAIEELLKQDNEIIKKDGKQGVIVGSCQISKENNGFSYGGIIDSGVVIPNGKLQECKFINGNIVLVPKNVFKVIGNLSDDYTHGIGDLDYGLRAIENDFKCYISNKYIAYCEPNGMPAWCNPKIPLIKRLKILHSPKGLNIKEQIIYRKRYWGSKWIVFVLKFYFRAVFPSLYNKIKILP